MIENPSRDKSEINPIPDEAPLPNEKEDNGREVPPGIEEPNDKPAKSNL